MAFCTNKGVCQVYIVNTSVSSTPQIIGPSNGLGSLNGNNFGDITCLRWSLDEKQFYYGDKKGQVNLVVLNSYMGRSIITVSVHPILFTDAPIVQIDDYESLLLVSNYNKCLICNTEYEEYKQVRFLNFTYRLFITIYYPFSRLVTDLVMVTMEHASFFQQMNLNLPLEYIVLVLGLEYGKWTLKAM